METSPYLAGLRRHALRYQQCDACTAVQTLTRLACASCGSAQLTWKDSLGIGTVYAVTQVHRAPSDEFRAIAPYTLALVDLDEGCRVMAHAADGLRIGQRVRSFFLQQAGHVHAVFRLLHSLEVSNAEGEDT
jgi:uncharacterized OB-fold protein